MPPSPRQIPTVSLDDYRAGTKDSRDGFVRTFMAGLREFGFVAIANHGIADDVVRNVYSDVKALFALPASAKERYAVIGAVGQRGYTGFGQEHAKNRSVGDLKEFWHVGRELPALGDEGRNVWPKEVPTFQASTLTLFAALEQTAATLLEALADGFGAPRETFREMIREGNSVLRLLHYPPLGELHSAGAVRAAEHEDINLLTLLCESTSSGLEILTRDGEWLAVEAPKGTIVVDSGDMLQRITNGVIPSTTHRVVNPRGEAADEARYSIPFFVHPYPECVLQVLPFTTNDGAPAKHAPIAANAFLRERLAAIGLGK